MTIATTTGPRATVDVAHEASSIRIGPRTDGADLAVRYGEPLRLAVLVGRDPLNIAAANAAALGANADVVVSLGTAGRASLIDRATALRDARPHAALVIADKGDTSAIVELVEALRMGCASRPPSLFVSAEENARLRIAASAGTMLFEALPSPATSAGREAIVTRLRALRRGAGDVVLRDEAIEASAKALATSSGRSTLVLDVSGASTSLAYATPGGATIAAHSRLGVGPGADRVVAHAGLDRVRRWIPRPIDAPALLERVFNRTRWPDAVATSPLTLALEMSLAREAIAHLIRDARRAGMDVGAMRSAQLVVAAGDLARFPRPAQTALVVIDALGAEGRQLIARELADALVVQGAIATRSAVADVTGTIENIALAMTVSPKRATTVTVTDANGTMEERVARGALFLIPTSGGATVSVTGGVERQDVGPLALGVIVDARGRPLELPQRDAERVPVIARWYSALAALPVDGGAS